MRNKTYRLLTNVEEVLVGNTSKMWLNCHAILLEPVLSPLSDMPQGGQIRGFLTDGTLPVFSLPLVCGHLDYKMKLAKSTHATIETHRGTKLLLTSQRLSFDDDTELDLAIEDPERKLDIAEFDDITEVWKALPRKVLEYWRAPDMPVRCLLPVRSVPQYLDSMSA